MPGTPSFFELFSPSEDHQSLPAHMLEKGEDDSLKRLWQVSLSAYIFFFLVMLFTTGINAVLLYSTVAMLLLFFVTRVLIQKRKRLLTKNILMLLIYGGIFFYDRLLGKESGVYLYYFSFLLAALTIFPWKRYKGFAILYTALPLILVAIANSNHFTSIPVLSPKWQFAFYYFNFFLSFGLIVFNASYVISANIKYGEELRQSDLNLKTLIDNTNGTIWTIDNYYRLTAFNQNFKEEIKAAYNLDVFEGFDTTKIFSAKKNIPIWKEFYRRASAGENFTSQYQAKNNFYEVKVSPVYNEFGQKIGTAFHEMDITDRKKDEEKMEQMGLDLKSLIDNARGSIWSMDKNYRLIAYNKIFEITINQAYNEEIFVGYDLRLLKEKETDPKSFIQFFDDALAGKSYTSEFTMQENIFEIHFSPIYNIHDEQIGAVFYTGEITGKRKSDEAMVQMSLNLQTLIDNIEGSIWSISKDYKVIAANKIYRNDMRRIFGIPAVPGYNMRHIVNHYSYPKQWVDQYTRVFNGESISEEYEFDGRYYELQAAPIRNIYGVVQGGAFYSRDITEWKNVFAELTKAKDKAEDASKAKALFLSTMTHELKTPLNGIIGLSNILLSETYLPSQFGTLETLKYSADHMMSLVGDILDFNKIEAGKLELSLESFNIKSALDKLSVFFKSQAKTKGLNFVADIHEALNIEVEGDMIRIQQVLNNLLSNAVKFTNYGSVKLEARPAGKSEDGYIDIHFSVIDTGIGITDEQQEKIFDSFTQADAKTTRKYGGTGLGLTISKRLVEIMGGNMLVQSVQGEGSRFSFELKVKTVETFVPVIPVEKKISDFKPFDKLEILIAEDNAVNLMVAKRILQKWNIEVSNAENGLVALEKVQQKKYDLVLMDLDMPVMDGLTAVGKIREFNTKLPIIALTASSPETMGLDLTKAGLNDLVRKPFKPEDLYNKISQHIAHVA